MQLISHIRQVSNHKSGNKSHTQQDIHQHTLSTHTHTHAKPHTRTHTATQHRPTEHNPTREHNKGNNTQYLCGTAGKPQGLAPIGNQKLKASPEDGRIAKRKKKSVYVRQFSQDKEGLANEIINAYGFELVE